MIFFQSHQITIKRNRNIGGNRYAMSATYTAVMDLQPASPDRVELINGRFGAAFQAFVDISVDVKEGDQLSVEGKIYAVKGVQVYDGAGLLSHKELLLMSEDA